MFYVCRKLRVYMYVYSCGRKMCATLFEEGLRSHRIVVACVFVRVFKGQQDLPCRYIAGRRRGKHVPRVKRLCPHVQGALAPAGRVACRPHA